MFIILFICFSAFNVCAEKEEELFNEITGSLESIIDEDTKNILEDFGIDDFSYDEIYTASFDNIGKYFQEYLYEKIKNITGYFFQMLCVLILVSVIKNFFSSDNGKSYNYLGNILVILMSGGYISDTLNVMLSSMKTGSAFMISFVPIYTVIIALSGSISSAVSYNTVTLAYAELLTGFINNYAVDIVGLFIAVSISLSFNSMINLNRFVAGANKTVNTVIGFLAGIFTAVLSFKGVLSVSLDSASSKSIRFLITNLIPIVGSSISDAYSSLVGSINLIKGSVAAIGIIVILIISAPAIIEGGVYCICFSFLSCLAEMFGENQISLTLKALNTGIKTILLLSVLQTFILIISTGIMLSVKGAL